MYTFYCWLLCFANGDKAQKQHPYRFLVLYCCASMFANFVKPVATLGYHNPAGYDPKVP